MMLDTFVLMQVQEATYPVVWVAVSWTSCWRLSPFPNTTPSVAVPLKGSRPPEIVDQPPEVIWLLLPAVQSPDQQFQAGLFWGSVHATITTPTSASALAPAAICGDDRPDRALRPPAACLG